MGMKTWGWLTGAAFLVAVAPGLRGASVERPTVVTIDDVVRAARATGASGWELARVAQEAVASYFDEYSCEHPLLSPSAALMVGKGFSAQYNGVLAAVLRQLGFDVEPVFAARTHLRNAPWWHSGHMWLQVTLEGETRDVCAQYSLPSGDISFTPTTEVLPYGARTNVDVRAVLVLTSAYQWWKHKVTGRPFPRWFKHPFGQR